MRADLQSGRWEITEEERAEIVRLFPGVNLERELRHTLAWCSTHGQRGKKRNWKRFLYNWLRRSDRHETRRGEYAEPKARPPVVRLG